MRRHRLGLVSLVGAGPGDPDHLTLKAARCLRDADLVLYDALVAPAVLELAERADLVFVGKRAGRAQTAQTAINAAMIAAARGGRRVVRLKGGDPFVFGRGSEEALALQAAGVPYEIVPGVTSAVAAPALSGIPLTHRGVASGVVVLTGADGATCAAALDALPPDLLTLVFLMSLGTRAAIAERLLARGWQADTPSALLLGAATPGARTWRGALADLATAPIPPDRADLPGTIVVGHVAGLALMPDGAPTDTWAVAVSPSTVPLADVPVLA
jgi:uroporphyrin-III C-methyltransferase/precorrin-2 dehydrogenase/sirohydrochlorin ferrochelatase